MSAQLRLEDDTLADYLRGIGLASPGEEVQVGRAGDGNINWVRRATVNGPEHRSYVVKQARPALERFPEYQVSTDRIVYEARWLQVVRPFDDTDICPRVHAFDPVNRVLVLEDLGEVERLDRALAEDAAGSRGEGMARRQGLSRVAEALGSFLGRVHRETAGQPLGERFRNDDMRGLHGDHIFALPYGAEGFPLPPALAAEAHRLRRDTAFRESARAAHARYLEPRGALVHGDVQAGNVLLPAQGPKLLDAEIAHVGDPAFDLGTLLAHLCVCAVARGEGEGARPLLEASVRAYLDACGPRAGADPAAAVRYAGLELLRRTLGAARLPVVEDPEAGLRAVAVGESWVRHPLPVEEAPL